MVRQLIPLVLAVVIGATPIAHEICEMSCAEPATASSSHAHHGTSGSMPKHEMPGHDRARHQMGSPEVGNEPAPGHNHGGGSSAVAHSASAASCCRLTVSAALPCCGHADQSRAVSAAAAKVALDPPAIAPRVLDGTDLIGVVAVVTTIRFVAPAPIPLSLRTPLRV